MENKIKLTDQQINTILNEHLDQYFWFFQLGQNTTTDLIRTDNDFSFPFYEKGKEIFEKYKTLLKKILCDSEKMALRNSIEELLLGNIREIIYVIVTELCNTHDLALSIAIPLTAIVLKMGLQNFCNK